MSDQVACVTEPRLDDLPEDVRARVRLAVACRDCDLVPKVPDAGGVVERDGVNLQVMHNGLVIEAGCYYGPWMTEIIRCLRGHHEPQEELVFHRILERLREQNQALAMIEFGSFWTYYGMWFALEFPAGRVVAVEPDPAYLEVGRRNWALNQLSARIDFVHGVIGPAPGDVLDFVAESDGTAYPVRQYDLGSVMAEGGLDRADLVLLDVQGAESTLVDRAAADLAAGRIRFLIVSTHHHSISGSALTHQEVLGRLRDCGAHVIAEHAVSESFSGDGLIAVSFDERDRDLRVPLSYARAQDSLFGSLEPDLDAARREAQAATAEAAALRARLSEVETTLDAVQQTKLWRFSRRPRTIYSRLRRRPLS